MLLTINLVGLDDGGDVEVLGVSLLSLNIVRAGPKRLKTVYYTHLKQTLQTKTVFARDGGRGLLHTMISREERVSAQDTKLYEVLCIFCPSGIFVHTAILL